MPQSKEGQSPWGGFIAVILLAALLAAWALIPAATLDSSWRIEQEQMKSWAGESTNRWILSQAKSVLDDTAKVAAKAAAGLDGNQSEAWLVGRITVTLLWGSLIVYRLYALAMWGLLGIPLILAASVDGYYVREIRKHSFVSQSPIRHKVGIHFFRLAGIGMVVWLCLPVPVPTIAAPAVICFMAISMWLWVSNLQKRL